MQLCGGDWATCNDSCHWPDEVEAKGLDIVAVIRYLDGYEEDG